MIDIKLLRKSLKKYAAVILNNEIAEKLDVADIIEKPLFFEEVDRYLVGIIGCDNMKDLYCATYDQANEYPGYVNHIDEVIDNIIENVEEVADADGFVKICHLKSICELCLNHDCCNSEEVCHYCNNYYHFKLDHERVNQLMK